MTNKLPERQLRRLFPDAPESFIKANSQVDRISPSPVIEHSVGKALHAPSEVKTRSLGRCRVSFTCYRVRKQDPDNAVVKWFVDALRRAKIIQDDTEEAIELQVRQVKCSTKKEERTEIIIEQL